MNKKLILSIASLFLIANVSFAQLTGSDNGFGYTWRVTPNVPENWVDIDATGNNVFGLGDDNFVGPIPLGFSFKYFWNEYNEVYVGSNGYLMFGEGKNIASVGNAPGPPSGPGFFNIPFAGDDNHNFLAPYLSDLTFVTAQGNPAVSANGAARVRYQTIGNKFIISFLNVPFWNGNVNPTQVSGNNNFQVILDGDSNHVLFNYRQHGTGRYTGYTNWVRIGFENITGQLGAQIRGNLTAQAIAQLTNGTIKITYPQSTTFSFKDAAVVGVFNRNNWGQAFAKGTPATLKGVVRNSGTNAITDPITVRMLVLNDQGDDVYNSSVVLGGLAVGQDSTVTFPAPFTSVDEVKNFTAILSTQVAGDQYAPNNSRASKLSVIDTAGGALSIVYTDRNNYNPNNVTINTQNAGMVMESPVYPVALRKIQFDAVWINPDGLPGGINWQDSTMAMRVRLFKGDGENGALGTFVDSFTVDVNNMLEVDTISPVFNNAGVITFYVLRHTYTLPQPILWDKGTMYAGVFQNRTTRFLWNSLTSEITTPSSFRSQEMPGNVWGPSRSRDSTDYPIALVVTFDTTGSIITRSPAKMASAELMNMDIFPNPAKMHTTIRYFANKPGEVSLTIRNAQGKTVKTLSGGYMDAGKNEFKISLDGLKAGTYFYTLAQGGKTITRQVLVVQ